MLRRIALPAITVVSAVSIALLAACGSSPSATVKVTEKEWTIAPDLSQAKSGTVKFNVTNNGTEPHEFLIFKTDLAPDQLAQGSDAVNEDSLDKVEDSDPIDVGKTFTKDVTLTPGKYVLVCNIVENPPGQPAVGHYQKGMRAAFTVSQ